ncbi:MAG: alpha/beta hydrolase [Actinomyces sp.]|nr:alpha/beta hydrolase [Actinomyces sp.]
MSVTSNPTPDGEQMPDTSGLPDLSGVGAEASAPEGIPERDVMAPWGEAGPPGPQWRTDILGEGYESRTIELIDDAEGPCVATLVRARPPASARMTVLYLHGRNDYFFQTEMAQRLSDAGAAFYALDMRKYGRSLRPHQTIGYTDDLSVYDEEIGEAIEIIRSEREDEPIVLPDDPSVAGWPIIHEWKRPESYPIPASWLEAIMAGHETIEKDVHLECPVLSMVSTSSYFDEEWSERVFTSDTVLDPTVIAQRSLGLSDLVTIARFPGKHDLALSDAPVREAVYATMRGWLDAFVR